MKVKTIKVSDFKGIDDLEIPLMGKVQLYLVLMVWASQQYCVLLI